MDYKAFKRLYDGDRIIFTMAIGKDKKMQRGYKSLCISSSKIFIVALLAEVRLIK